MWARHRSLVTALTSGFVGALALASSIYNVYLQRRQIQAQVWPHLELGTSNGDCFKILLGNSGVGPAIIKGARVTVDGKPVRSWGEAHSLLTSTDHSLDSVLNPKFWSYSSFSHRVLAPGADIHPVEFRCAAEGDVAVLEKAYGRLEMELCYCSTMDECWLLTSEKGAVTQPNASCPKERLTFEQ